MTDASLTVSASRLPAAAEAPPPGRRAPCPLDVDVLLTGDPYTVTPAAGMLTVHGGSGLMWTVPPALRDDALADTARRGDR